MNWKNFIILVFSFFFVVNQIAIGQTAPIIEKSNEKALIGGKVYFIHTVKKGETLYSIAKAYNVTVEEVISSNPSMNSDLTLGQTIRIPDQPAKKSNSSIDESQVMHVVSAGQTIYAISRIYGVSVADIESVNPEVKYDSLQINQVLKIPVDKKKNLEQQNYTIHKVAEKETLYSLAKKYNISQEELIKFNAPNLNDGLKTGQEIKIPNKPTETNTLSSKKNNIQINTPVISQQDDKNCTIESLKVKFDTIDISLLLPLYASGKKEESSSDGEDDNEIMQLKPSDEFDPIAVNFIEFYQGFMLATNELKRKGLHITVSVFDTEKDEKNILPLFDKTGLRKSNLIFGPIYTDQVNAAAEKVKAINSIIISPVAQHDAITQKNPKLYQVNPGLDLEYKKCIDYLLSDTAKNIIIIYKSESNSNEDNYKNFNSLLNTEIEKRNCKVRKLNVFNNDFSGIMNELDSLKDNIVFSPESDEIFITTLYGQLDAKLILYRIQAVALQEYINYPSIDLNYFYELNTVYFSTFFSDTKSQQYTSILKKYRLLYGTEPVRYSKFGFNYGILGYNLAYYFISAYAYFGYEISNHGDCLKKLPVSIPMYFNQLDDNGGFTNTNYRKVSFNKDYSLTAED